MTTFPSHHASSIAAYEPAPSMDGREVTLRSAPSLPPGTACVGMGICADDPVPAEAGLDWSALRGAGFDGKIGQALLVPRAVGPALVVTGLGQRDKLDAAALRDAAAAFARAASRKADIAMSIPALGDLSPAAAGQAVVEGVLLARYRYPAFKHDAAGEVRLESLTLVDDHTRLDELQAGIDRGGVSARAAAFARDLANAPAALLTARRMADIARAIGAKSGLGVEVIEGEELEKMGCGGLLGVNAGSDEPARLIKLSYRPGDGAEPAGRVALIGKGIMYDSGGISLKPGDLVHATMKVDMSGAGAILAAMSSLAALGCRAAVTGYLMCTDNMPSGKAMRLGDVLTVRGGKTIEVLNTDAEGRLVMADGLVLATEEDPQPDVIVDIATLTGACQRALGKSTAGVMGNDQALIEQLEAAAARSDETIWQLPLDRRYRKELDSAIADMKNIGGDDAGAITAALFLEAFVGKIPWAHLDIAGTAQVDRDDGWLSKGATGFGARLLIDFLSNFTPPGATLH